MRVTRDGRPGGAFDRAFEFAEAAQELVVELTFSNQVVGCARERALDAGEFFREQFDGRLRGAQESCLGLVESVGEASDEAHDCVSTLIVNPEDVRLAK